MTEHELNLIAEYAAGSLPTEEVEAVEAKIASDSTARAEYEAQLAALSALSAAAPAELTAGERASLRAAVADELHIVREEPVPETKSRWRPIPWARLGTVAAVLTAVVIAAPFVSTLSTSSGDGDAEDFGEISAQVPAETSRRAADPVVGIAESDNFDAASTIPPATASAEVPPADVPQGGVAPEAGPLPLADFGDLTSEDLTRLSSNLRANALADDSLAGEFYFNLALDEGALEREGVSVPPDLLETCPAEADQAVPGFEDSAFFGFGRLDGTPVVMFVVTPAGGGEAVLVVFDEATCRVLEVLGA